MIVRFIIGGLFAAFALLTIVGNAWVLKRQITGPGSPSAIPILGGLSGALAVAILFYPSGLKWMWVPAMLDYGCGPALIMFAIAWWRQRAPRT